MNKIPCIEGKHTGNSVTMFDGNCMLCVKAGWQKMKFLPNFTGNSLELNKVILNKEAWARIEKPLDYHAVSDPRINRSQHYADVLNAITVNIGDDPIYHIMKVDLKCVEFLARGPEDFSVEMPELISVESFLSGEF